LRPDLYHAKIKITRQSLCLSQLHHLTTTSPAKAIYSPVKSPREADSSHRDTAVVHRVRSPDAPTPANQPSQHLGTAQQESKTNGSKSAMPIPSLPANSHADLDMGNSGELQSLHAVVEVEVEIGMLQGISGGGVMQDGNYMTLSMQWEAWKRRP
jgi:hypothetical protein